MQRPGSDCAIFKKQITQMLSSDFSSMKAFMLLDCAYNNCLLVCPGFSDNYWSIASF